MDEHIRAAVYGRRDEAKSLVLIEKLYCAYCHGCSRRVRNRFAPRPLAPAMTLSQLPTEPSLGSLI